MAFNPVFNPVFNPTFNPAERAFADSVNDLLDSAWARFDQDSIVGSNPVTQWQNRNGIAARDLDVVVGIDANLITLESGEALHTGTAGDNYTTPDSAAASVTDDITVEWIGYMFDWTPGAVSTLVAKWEGAGKLSYWLRIDTNGNPRFFVSVDGTAIANVDASTNTGFTDGALGGVRVKWDQSANTADYETTSDGGATWSALGSQRTLTAAGIDDNTGILEVGSDTAGTGNVLAGKTVRAKVYNDATATNVVVDFDPSKATVNTATFTSGGVVWTANGDAFVNATNFTGIYSRGSVGLETTAGQPLSNPITAFIALKPTLASPVANQFALDGRSITAGRSALFNSGGASNKYSLFQGLVLTLTQDYDSDLRVVTLQLNGNSTSKLTVSDVGSVTGDMGANNWDFGTVFSTLNTTDPFQGIIFELIVDDRAYSDEEVSLMQNHLEAKYA